MKNESVNSVNKDFEVIVYSDGACSGNPGPGGWGVLLKDPATGKTKELSGGEKKTYRK